MCRFYLTEQGCRFGSKCRFAHDAAAAADDVPQPAAAPPPPFAKSKGGSSAPPIVRHNPDKFRYNFEGAEFLDHFETPQRAYEDLAPALRKVAALLGKEVRDLRIYDPYFCRGSMKSFLGDLGFQAVYNENEDCYSSARWRDASLYDVIVTNPPYSGTHKERFMTWARQTRRPWFCLMWSFAASKQWYRDGAHDQRDWFVAPLHTTRYDFRNPLGKGMHGGSPYPPLWFCNTQRVEKREGQVMQALLPPPPGVRVTQDISALAAQGVVRVAKRANPRQRAKARLRDSSAHAGAGGTS